MNSIKMASIALLLVLILSSISACGSSSAVTVTKTISSTSQITPTITMPVVTVMNTITNTITATPASAPPITTTRIIIITPTPVLSSCEISEVSMKILETNNSWWQYSWILKVKNVGNIGVAIDAQIKFLDAEGFLIDYDNEYGLYISSNTEESFTGFVLIDTSVASRVASVTAEINIS